MNPFKANRLHVLKRFTRNLMPPLFLQAFRSSRSRFNRRPQIGFWGDFKKWEEAQHASTGYEAPQILERTRAAIQKVVNGEAAYERDSVIFHRIEYQFPLLAGLLRAASENDGRLHVVDFGGSLGSSYFQCRTFFPHLKELSWNVVEQSAHVEVGRQHFASRELHFFHTIEECVAVSSPNVLLISGVIQYLDSPYKMLERLVASGFRTIILDRTPFMRNGKDRLTVETVPDWIYPASYPAWFLSEERFLSYFSNYKLVATFAALDSVQPEGGEADHKGFIFEKLAS